MSTSRRHDRYGPTATPQVKDHDRVMEPHRPGVRGQRPRDKADGFRSRLLCHVYGELPG